MGTNIGAVEIVNWIILIFPSFSQYAKIVTPIFIFTVSVMGVFCNILPPPGNPYALPSLSDLNRELKGKGWVVYGMVKICFHVTVMVNRIVAGKPYMVFYKSTKKVADLINRLKGKNEDDMAVKITKPEHFDITAESILHTKSDDPKHHIEE